MLNPMGFKAACLARVLRPCLERMVPLGATFQLERLPPGERAGNHNFTCLPKGRKQGFGHFTGEGFSVMYINWSYYGVSVYHDTRRNIQ